MQICSVIGGRGGGKDGQAQATGESAEKLDDAVALAEKLASSSISA